MSEMRQLVHKLQDFDQLTVNTNLQYFTFHSFYTFLITCVTVQ